LSPENLDELIKKYSEALVEMGQTYGGEVPLERAETAEKEPKSENEAVSDIATTDSDDNEKPLSAPETATEAAEIELTGEEDDPVNTEPAVKAPSVNFEEGEATSSATFFARVFTGEGAYPVKEARVVVYRGDNIYAFLETDAEGKTKTVRLPAFEESNSLESDNENRSIDYFADIFAQGFDVQKGLLISAVGGSDIVLNVLVVPEKEGLS